MRADGAQPLGERRRAGEHEVCARGEALLRGAEAGGVDALLRGDVIDAVVDDERGVEHVDQRLGLRDVAPQDRLVHAQARRGAADEGGEQPRVERADDARAVQRQHERREHVQSVRLARGREATAQPAPDASEVAPGELRAAQAERLDEEDAVLAREARHQVVLVGPQLGVPVGEADAHDVAAVELGGLGHRRP